MEQRRIFLFVILSLGMWLAYTQYVLPKFLPPPPAKDVVDDDDKGAEANAPPVAQADRKPLRAPRPLARDKERENIRRPAADVTIGSLDPASGYLMQVEVLSRGAAIGSLKLNDERFRELADQEEPLELLGHDTKGPLNTLAMSVPKIDDELLDEVGETLTQLNWELAETIPDPDNAEITQGVVFRWTDDATGLRVSKRFTVPKLEDVTANARKASPDGYMLDVDLTIENISGERSEVAYKLVGPVGIRLENEESTRKFRDLRFGSIIDGAVEDATVTAPSLVEAEQEKTVELFREPLRYAGVDNQYFAALIVPEEPQQETRYFDAAKPFVVNERDPLTWSDVSFTLSSLDLQLAPGESITHQLQLYAGPKREDLLAPLGADEVLDYGFFGIIAKVMLWILNGLYAVVRNYGLAIIGLTVLVRACMFPLSKKQALNAEKMKELQPEIKAIQERYKNNREALAQAQMELFRKHNYNPLAGCLPIFLQLPIFFGLYSALYVSVDLRMAEFLWINDLSAPDHLFKLPFRLPFLGQWFNLLPLLTIVLFIAQQKMFMPTPDTPEGKMQMKIMNFFMIFMGFLFYHVPAGLCLYFIASSMWGIAERQLLKGAKAGSGNVELQTADGVTIPAGGGQARGSRVRRSESKRNRR